MSNSNGRVLVVEDDAEINELVGAYAQLAGFSYEPALTGQSAIDKATQLKPALIVLDVMLPDIDGFEVCRRLKASDRTRSIPVVILTALAGDAYERRSADCGASGFLTKPFDPDRLIEAIKSNAGGKGSGA
jgi:DNA-binding response OmpR family regulator